MLTIPPHQIGFDFDGVIADIGETFIRLACTDHGYCSIELDNLKTFQVEESLEIPVEIIEKIFNDILENPIGTGLKPISGAIETLSRLAGLSGVTIITARPVIDPVRDWLNVYCDQETAARIKVIASGDPDDKERHIRQHNLSYFIDDRLHTCVQLAAAGLTPVVFSQPWNRSQHGLASVENWQEIDRMLDLRESDL